MDYNNDLSQRLLSATPQEDGNPPRSSEGGNCVYVTASTTRMDTVIFMHKWSISQFSVQQELSNAGDFLESK